jgi:hypothetical protein
MMSYWERVDERLIKRGEKWLDMVGGGWLRLQYPGSRHCSENIPLSRKPRWMDSELKIKALIHNMLLSAVTT